MLPQTDVAFPRRSPAAAVPRGGAGSETVVPRDVRRPDGQRSGRSREPEIVARPQSEPDGEGRLQTKTALLLGDGEQCAYEIKGNLNLSAGTISLWAKPHNWNDREGRFGRENTHQLRGNKWWYMDTLDDVAWRVEYVDHASGLMHMFLPVMRGTSDTTDLESPQPSESLLAMLRLTDANTTGGFMNREAMGDWWGLRERLDLVDADFTGYWEANCPVKTVTPKALASSYRTQAGDVVIPVTNRLSEATEVTVTIDLKVLDLEGKAITAMDERTGKRLELKDGAFTVTVKGRNYTLISLTVR